MIWLNIEEISAMVDGVLYGNNVAVNGVSTDTRTLNSGDLFIALQGENFDGHNFVNHNITASLVSHKLDIPIPQIIVKDTLEALSQLALAWRRRLHPVVIAVTGSNGKTTTKEMIFSILQNCMQTLATRGNLNNHIGVPCTLLSLRAQHEAAVIELGANHQGEIRALSDLVEPDIGVVTNAGCAHLEGFGSIQMAARTKGELFEKISEKGTAIINADDDYYHYWCSLLKTQHMISFGKSQYADVCYSINDAGNELCINSDTRPVHLSLSGQHNMQNAAAAAAVAYSMNIEFDTIIKGLESMAVIPGRACSSKAVYDNTLIDDSYNCNPDSLTAALQMLQSYSGEHWLVLGDMQELGERTEDLHSDAGYHAKHSGVKRLFTIGSLSKQATQSFGVGSEHFTSIKTLQDCLLSSLKQNVSQDIVILVKGSRSMHMEKVAQALREVNATC